MVDHKLEPDSCLDVIQCKFRMQAGSGTCVCMRVCVRACKKYSYVHTCQPLVAMHQVPDVVLPLELGASLAAVYSLQLHGSFLQLPTGGPLEVVEVGDGQCSS